MQPGNSHAATVIEPNDDTSSSGVHPGVIGAGHSIATAAAGNDYKRLKWSSLQVLTHVTNHTCGTLRVTVGQRKLSRPPSILR